MRCGRRICGRNISAKEAGLNVFDILQENDSYHGLDAIGGLIRTGATGTNVNDVSVVLIRRK